MSRSRALLIWCVMVILAESLLRPRTSTAQAASPQLSDTRTACASDMQKLCPGVPTDSERIFACLREHKEELSDGCKQAILTALGKASGDSSSAASPAPAPAAVSPAPPAPQVEHHHDAGYPSTAPSGSRSKLMMQSSQDYPTKTVRMIEPFGAGGGPDVISRAVSPKLSALWGQPVTVENHPGAGSTAAPALVATSPPDGYTLLVNTSAHAYSAAVLKNLPYNPLKDFIPVAPLTSQPYVLVAAKSSGIATVRELISAAKAKPGELKFGSTGRGTGTHLGLEKFNLAAGIKATHVPARPGDAIADVIANTIAGHTTYMMAPIQLALADIRAGNLRALGVTTKKRSSLLPEVPTIAETGVSGFDYPIWYGVWVPAGTPAGVVDKIAKDIARVMAAPDLRDQLAKDGADPMSMTQPEFARFVLSESESAARIVEAAGSKP